MCLSTFTCSETRTVPRIQADVYSCLQSYRTFVIAHSRFIYSGITQNFKLPSSRLLNPTCHLSTSTKMGSIDDTDNGSKFVLTAEALNKALPDMHPSTRAIHADDFVTPHRAIAPGMHTAVNFRYARDPEDLVPEENKDVSLY